MSLRESLGADVEEVRTNRRQVADMLAAARTNLNDAQVTGLSAENRFDIAYKAIMQCALVALLAHGLRPLASRPGHHRIAIQSLELTINVSHEQVELLNALRRQRNRVNYSGALISDSTAAECSRAAAKLLGEVRGWLRENRKDLS